MILPWTDERDGPAIALTLALVGPTHRFPNPLPLLAELVNHGGTLPIRNEANEAPIAYALQKAAFGNHIQLALEFAAPIPTGGKVYIPAWMPNLRGSKGEWFAPCIYRVTAV